MNKRQNRPVSLSVALHPACILSALLLLPGCASQREVGHDRVLRSGQHEAGSAIDSDYFVQRGAVLKVDFSSGSRFYVQSGGSLTGFDRGVRGSTVYAEEGASTPSARRITIVRVKNARTAYLERNAPIEEELGPGTVTTGIVAGGAIGTRHDDEDDYHYHDHHHGKHRSGNVSISGSSYKKKNKD